MRRTLSETMLRLEFPGEAVETLLSLYDRLENDSDRMDRMQKLCRYFYAEKPDMPRVLDSLTDLAVNAGESPYTVHLLYFLMLSPALREKYAQAGIPEWVFWDTMTDLRCKLWECYKMYGQWGTFVSEWFTMFYQLERFGLGRLQFEPRAYGYSEITVHGVTVKPGDPIITIHIPSMGPLTRESRLDSYRKAYEFFKDRYPDGKVPIVCGSWLLYPKNEEFFPAGSNIVSFMHDFKPIGVVLQNAPGFENFSNGWRVFYKPETTPMEALPRETSLQRAYIDWFRKGGDSGSGAGILIADETGFHID